MKFTRQLAARSETIVEVFTFLWERKLWWLIPLAVLMLFMGVLFFIAQASSVAPWMYPL